MKGATELLDRPIAFHRAFVALTGSVTAALMLSQALYWSRRTTIKLGWFYKTADDWEKETGLSRREQETARRRLRDLGLIKETRRGVPATLYFQLQTDELDRLLVGRMAESANQDVRKTPNWIGGKGESISEITPETSQEDTMERGNESFCQSSHIRFEIPKPADVEAFYQEKKIPFAVAASWFRINSWRGWKVNGEKIAYWQEALTGYAKRYKTRPIDPITTEEFFAWIETDGHNEDLAREFWNANCNKKWMRKNPVTEIQEPIFDIKTSYCEWLEVVDPHGSR